MEATESERRMENGGMKSSTEVKKEGRESESEYA